MGTYIRRELEFILNQIKIAETYDDAPAPAQSSPVVGAPPDDVLLGTSGGDLVFGFAGIDYIVTGAGPDAVGAGDDFAGNEAGRDVLFGDVDDDDVFDDGEGDDLPVAWPYDPSDAHYRDDISIDGSNDTITPRNSVAVVDGGEGEDVFVFSSTAAADGGTIRDLRAGDKIDLSGIDANAGVAGNTKFTLEDDQETTAPGQIVVTNEAREDSEYTVIPGDTAGDTAPEFGAGTADSHSLPGADFDL